MLAEWKAHVVDLQEESAMIFDLSADVLRRMGTLGGPWQPPLPTMSGGGLPRSQPDLTRVVRDAELMSLALARREAFALQEFALRPMAALADRVLARLEELQQ
jgi:hypothetical protein